MKTTIMIITLSLGLLTCGVFETISATTSAKMGTLTGKIWKISSITTEPAIIDVDGDGKKDKEIIGSLQSSEREKTISFKPNGVVEETFITTNGSIEVEYNGSWKMDQLGESFLWKLSDKSILKGQVQDNNIELTHIDSNLEIRYTLVLQSI